MPDERALRTLGNVRRPEGWSSAPGPRPRAGAGAAEFVRGDAGAAASRDGAFAGAGAGCAAFRDDASMVVGGNRGDTQEA